MTRVKNTEKATEAILTQTAISSNLGQRGLQRFNGIIKKLMGESR